LTENEKYCYGNVRQFTKQKRIDIFAYKKLIFPIHVRGVSKGMKQQQTAAALIAFSVLQCVEPLVSGCGRF